MGKGFSLFVAFGAAAALAGCVGLGPRRPDPQLLERVIADAAGQVKRCYRMPRVARPARQIVTRLRVRLGPDGTLVQEPEVVAQHGITPGNQVFAPQMADAAIRSVQLCAPLTLPAELYEFGWNEFDLTFSPALMG